MLYSLTLLLLSGCGAEDRTATMPEHKRCVSWQGVRVHSTPASDEWQDVLISSTGEVYLAGYQQGITGVATNDPSGPAQGILFQLDDQGQEARRFTLPATGTNVIEAIAFNEEQNQILLAGRTTGALAGSLNAGQSDLISGSVSPLLTTDSALLRQSGNERPQHPRRLLSTGSSLVIAGSDDIYVPTNYVERWESPWLQQLATDNNWHYQPDISVSGGSNGLSSNEDGTQLYLLSHRSAGAGRGTLLQAFNTSGQLLWQQQLTHSPYDSSGGLLTLADGRLLAAVSTYESVAAPSAGASDILLVWLDSNGDILQRLQDGSSADDWVTDITQDDNGNLYLTGERYQAPQTNKPAVSSVFVQKRSAVGDLLFSRQWDSDGWNTATAIAVDDCGNAVIAGHFSGAPFTAAAAGRDAFVLSVATP